MRCSSSGRTEILIQDGVRSAQPVHTGSRMSPSCSFRTRQRTAGWGFERILLALVCRLERHDAGIAVLRAAHGVLSSLVPYTPAYTVLPPGRTQARIAVVVRASSIAGAGQGLFVCEPVAAGAIIAEYCGDTIDSILRWLRTRNLDYAARTSDDQVRIDPAAHPEVQARYINHHDDARARNVQFKEIEGRRYYVATRAIAAGEELFSNYGDFYWKLKGQWPRSAQRPARSPASNAPRAS